MRVSLAGQGDCSEHFGLPVLDGLDIHLEAVEVGELARSVFVVEDALECFSIVGADAECNHGCDVGQHSVAGLFIHLTEVLVGER